MHCWVSFSRFAEVLFEYWYTALPRNRLEILSGAIGVYRKYYIIFQMYMYVVDTYIMYRYDFITQSFFKCTYMHMHFAQIKDSVSN